MSGIDFREFKKEQDLLHFGIKRRSGRYPWGSGDRPYQSGGGFRTRRKMKKAQKAYERLQKDQKYQQALTEKYARNRERIVKRGTPHQVEQLHKRIGLTNQELQEATNRFRLEDDLQKALSKTQKSAFDRMDSAMDKVGKINNWTTNTIQLWNNMASLYNTTEQGSQNPMKKINTGGGKKK